MTRNIKKLLAVVLVLAMSGSMMIVAWANGDQPTATGDAEIRFVGAWDDEIVYIPEGPGPVTPGTGPPTPPPIGENDEEDVVVVPPTLEPPVNHISDMNLNFWEHYQPNVLRHLSGAPTSIDFHSMRLRNAGWDVGRPAGAPGGLRDRTTANLHDQSVAGLWVTAADVAGSSWNINVRIDAFDYGALLGASIDLYRYGPLVVGVDVDSTSRPSVNHVSLPASDTSDTENIMQGTAGFVGGTNFEGRLNAHQNTSFEDTQTEMFWTFERVPPPTPPDP